MIEDRQLRNMRRLLSNWVLMGINMPINGSKRAVRRRGAESAEISAEKSQAISSRQRAR